MSDSALADPGVNTIGDRIRLRELCTKHVFNQRQTDADEDDENVAALGTNLNRRDSVRQERSLLFQPNSTAARSGSSGRGKKRKNSCPQRTWTVQFVSFIALREENPDYNREKHATSSRFRV